MLSSYAKKLRCRIALNGLMDARKDRRPNELGLLQLVSLQLLPSMRSQPHTRFQGLTGVPPTTQLATQYSSNSTTLGRMKHPGPSIPIPGERRKVSSHPRQLAVYRTSHYPVRQLRGVERLMQWEPPCTAAAVQEEDRP